MTGNHLKKQLWALEAYANSAKVLSHAKTPEELIQGVCEGITKQYPYVIAWVGIAENNPEKTVRVAGMSGKAKAYAQGIFVTWDGNKPNGRGPTGAAIRLGEPQMMRDSELDPNFAPWRERAALYGIRCSVGIPIFADEKVIGALTVYTCEPDSFSAAEIDLFQNLANEIGHGLALLQERSLLEEERKRRELAQQRLFDSLELTIGAMATTMEMRDPYTAGHQKAVAKIAQAIAKEMGLDKDVIHGLKMAALIHDIGKVSIPSELLTKPTKLSPLEYSLMKEHVNNGYLILKDIPFPWPIADMVRQHHERLDGSGYPQGLKGDEILMGARVLAVADIIESMSSHRPYRPALGLNKAIQEVLVEAGQGKLDPTVVQAAVKLYDRGELGEKMDK
ncbi:HD-GYP domain-containing protein [Polynucleobacter sp. MWH-UH25E]|uniref:HD-GYP domain-containing protein n=1 Tax=Polynucleobacter sp. MWH-UH25E TaxID=1855616 RepID=UPI001BFE480B|nr:HD domain-containing phosphohydrolase [Polynucleobacter sp. MWH-UH25E]QWD61870.1 HD domain-containing protein [Polynucleobacter sp. MWH-UH25E]